MQLRIHFIALAVGDLDRALSFYRDGRGLKAEGIIATELAGDEQNAAGAIAMFQLHDGLILSVYPRTELAKDVHVSLEHAAEVGLNTL